MLLPEKLNCFCPFPTLEHAIQFLSSCWLNHYTLQYKYDSTKLIIPSFPLLSSLCVWGIGLVCEQISFWWIRPIVLMVRFLIVWTFPDVVSVMNGSWTSFLALSSFVPFFFFSVSFYLWFIWHCSSMVRDNSHIVQGYNSSLLCPTGGKAERMRLKSLCKRTRGWEE